MATAKINWIDARTDYVTSDMSYRQIAEKYGVSTDRVQKRGSLDGWAKARAEYQLQLSKKTTAKIQNATVGRKVKEYKSTLDAADELLSAIYARMGKSDVMSARDIKAIASALKDINEICGIKSTKDAEEQQARIDKLRHDIESTTNDKQSIEIKIDGLPAEWKENDE